MPNCRSRSAKSATARVNRLFFAPYADAAVPIQCSPGADASMVRPVRSSAAASALNPAPSWGAPRPYVDRADDQVRSKPCRASMSKSWHGCDRPGCTKFRAGPRRGSHTTGGASRAGRRRGGGRAYARRVNSTPQSAPVPDSDRIAAADAYVDALASHRADDVPFAPDCVRIEGGIKTGFSGAHLRRSLNRGPQFRVIEATTDREYTVDGDYVHATFTVVTKAGFAGRRVVARVRETFLIPASDGLIHHIRARISPTVRREPA